MTGAPIKSLSLKEQDLNGKGIEHLNKENLKTWEYLLEAFTKNFVICASTRNFNQGSDEVDSSLGISGNHAYSVLGVYDMGKGRTDFEIIFFGSKRHRPGDETSQATQSLGQRRV